MPEIPEQPPEQRQGWLRGDVKAALYMGMDRKTWVALRRKRKITPSIVGKSRFFECAELDRVMRTLKQKPGACDLLRPALSISNRARRTAASQQFSPVPNTPTT